MSQCWNQHVVSVTILLVSFFYQAVYGVKYNVPETPEVLTSVGTIRGVRALDGNFSMYMGIPYAKVNLSNPFGASLPVPNFESPFVADDGSIACPQIEEYNKTFYGSLDCLTVNVYVPDSVHSKSPLPVIVYIFGGKFELGLATDFLIGPKFLMSHDVIFVTINYRLNLYGFMCLHTPEVPGNQGLRDQYEAFKWVKKHIATFGGDPNRITLQGSSSGATCIDLHVMSELEPFYGGVIMQSGSAFLEQLNGYDPVTPLRVAEILGLNTSDVSEAVAHLTAVDVETVVKAITAAKIEFRPCVEKKIDGVARMIASNAVNLKASKAKSLKVLIGTNSGEVDYMFNARFIEPSDFGTEINSWLSKFFNLSPQNLSTAKEIIIHYFTGDNEFTSDMIPVMADFYSDYWFRYPVQRTIRNYLDSGVKDIYYYIFSYLGDRNFHQSKSQFPKSKQKKAYHADELGYLFDMNFISYHSHGKITPQDQLIIDRMTQMWTNFAKYWDPTPNITDILPLKWQPITQERVYHYINITTNMIVGRRPYHRRMTFWDLFYQTYGQYEKTLDRHSDDNHTVENDILKNSKVDLINDYEGMNGASTTSKLDNVILLFFVCFVSKYSFYT